MLFKVISSDKIKILIENEDVERFLELENEIMNNVAGECVARLLVEIYRNTGISFLGNEIYIETVQGVSLSYYVIITRLLPDMPVFANKQNNEVDMFIFELEGIEQVFDVSELIDRYPQCVCCRADLYEYRQKGYICVYFSNMSDSVSYDSLIGDLKSMFKCCRWSMFCESMLHEWGCLICSNVFNKIKEMI